MNMVMKIFGKKFHKNFPKVIREIGRLNFIIVILSLTEVSAKIYKLISGFLRCD